MNVETQIETPAEGAAPAFAQWLRETCGAVASEALAEARALVSVQVSG